MILLVNGSTASVRKHSALHPGQLGHLLSPASGNAIESILATGLPWAVDNGAFGGFNPAAFWKLLGRIRAVRGAPSKCLWVACPDVVGDAKATLKEFGNFFEEIGWGGFKRAFVGQDGQENLPVPWPHFDCFFVGGTDEWKLSRAADSLCQEAKRRGKWVHVGRVNSLKRIRHSLVTKGADSIDGGSASRYGEKRMPQLMRWIRQERQMLSRPSFWP